MKKLRNTWKMRLSVLLMVVMMLNMTFTAFAEWKKEDGGWTYTKGNGNQAIGEVMEIQDKWYSFDQDGYMETGWIDDLGEGNRFYTVPVAGNLAEKQWLKIGEDWYYFEEIKETADGLKGGAVPPYEWRKIQNKYYYFGDEGKMYHDGFLDIDGRTNFYAFSDGSLANATWLCLSEDGKQCNNFDVDNCGCSWYYFKGIEEVKGEIKDELEGGAVAAKEGEGYRERPVGQSKMTYAFDEQGKMISRGWNNKTNHYFQCTGEKAAGKWLPIGAFWYQFNANGDVIKYAQIPGESGSLQAGISNVASASNAPHPTVSAITPINGNVEVLAGETVNVQFEVKLASGSNASNEKLTEDHDFWIKGLRNGKINNKKIEGNNYTFDYTNSEAGLEDIYLWIDGKKSEPVKITTTLIKTKEDEEVKTSDVKSAVTDILTTSAENVESAVSNLATIYDGEDDVKETVRDQLLSETNKLEALEKNYTDAKNIIVAAPLVSDAVQEKHGDIGASVTGAGLNVEAGEIVRLKVDVPEDDVQLSTSEDYQNLIPFNIELVIVSADDTENGESLGELRIPVVVTMKCPEGLTTQDKLINLHDGEEVNVKFTIKDGKVYFVTDRFSTYVFAITNKPVSTTPISSSNGGGRRGRDVNSELNAGITSNSRAGNWLKDAKGWWIRLTDGTYPINTWKYLDFNGVYAWYRFDSMGYMSTGWFTDADGHRYYLNPVSDGTQGAMATGWKFIDGYWYYFNPASDGTKGALLVNTTTPDGYTVNANGQWIQ